MNKQLTVILAVGFFLFSTSIFAQKPAPPPRPASPPPSVSASDTKAILGELDGHIYTNDFFGFTMSIPENFTILERTELELLADAGVDMIKSKNEGSSKTIEESAARTINILAITKFPAGRPGNAALEFAATRQISGVTPTMALQANVTLMTSTGSFKLIDRLKSVKFGGIVFEGAILESTAFGVPLRHFFYSGIVKNHSLLLAIAAPIDSSGDEFMPILQGMEPIKK